MEGRSTASEQADEQQRSGWRLRWLTSLQSFADAEAQRLRWLDPNETNPHYSYVECMCVYFDDVLHWREEPYRRRVDAGILSEQEAAAVVDFHALADNHKSPNGDDWDSRAIIEDPAWQKVVTAAQQAQRNLLPLLFDPAEIEALALPDHWQDENGVYRSARGGSAIVRLAN